MGYRRRTYRVMLDRLDREPLGRTTPKWVGNITMDLQEVGWEGEVWIDLVQDRDS